MIGSDPICEFYGIYESKGAFLIVCGHDEGAVVVLDLIRVVEIICINLQ